MLKSLFINMATGFTREWIKFFTGCGIPDDVAAMYSLIFCENRIQSNMLPDLNKEYLRDMGITVMGDIIAILRHAKTVHEKHLREEILSDKKSNNVPLVEPKTTPVKKTTSVKRMLEHYTRNYSPTDSPSPSDVQVILPNDKINLVSNTAAQKELKEKVMVKQKNNLSSKLNQQNLEVPLSKVRRVLPENEGPYKIKMPLGNTERFKNRILEQSKNLSLNKKRDNKTVFDRLGEGSVSSTTSELSSGISHSSASTIPTLLNKEKNSSVFSRLGEKASIVSSTSMFDESDYTTSNQLPYAGILKSGASPKKNVSSTTMRADGELQKSGVSVINPKELISVKKRLGVGNQEVATSKFQKKKITQSVASTTSQTKKGTLKLLNKGPSTTKNLSTSLQKQQIPKKSNNQKTTDGPIKGIVSTTSSVQEAHVQGSSLKRKLQANVQTDGIPLSKRVRFGKTTHRLIPATTSEPGNNIRNYPKLTMIVNNRTASNGISLSSTKVSSLNCDKLSITNKFAGKTVRGRLGKRMGEQISYSSPPKRSCSVHDRLG